VFLAACGSPAASPSQPPAPEASEPVATPSASAGEPSAEPERSPAPPVGGVPEGELMQVVADELRLRAEAGTEADLGGTLARGSVVRAESEPVDADGFTWVEVVDLAGRRGWAADGDGTDPWLAPIPDLTQGTPILTLERGCDVVGPFNPPQTTVFDDRWVLATDASAGFGWTVRRLSAEGLEQLEEGVIDSPYLQASARYDPQRLPGAEPPGHGACLYTFTISTEGDPIVVETVSWFGDEEESTFYEPSPERKALDGIARNLIAVNAILGNEAWEGPAAPYVGVDYQLGVGAGVGPAPDGAQTIDPDALGIGDVEEFGSSSGFGRCGTVTREQAFEIARVINEADPAAAVRLDALSSASFAIGSDWMGATLVPHFPHWQPDCASF
jgi:hypothetical protein